MLEAAREEFDRLVSISARLRAEYFRAPSRFDYNRRFL
jgi:hypothetical protein